METLVAVAQHKNQCYSKNRAGHGSGRFGPFGSPPLKDFRGINCRSYHHSGAGLLPTPIKTKPRDTPITRKAFSGSFSPKTLSPSVNSRSEEPKNSKKWTKSSAIPIPIKMKLNLNDEFCFSELWAGPAYSNSPPPSSLPIPKFSLKPKRTVSLELPCSASEIDLHPIAKSAPASPTRDRSLSPKDFFDDADSATKTLRRILNLDVSDE